VTAPHPVAEAAPVAEQPPPLTHVATPPLSQVHPPPVTRPQFVWDCSAADDVQPVPVAAAPQPFAFVPPSQTQPAVVQAFSPFGAAVVHALVGAAVQPFAEFPAPASHAHPTPYGAPPSSPTAPHVDSAP